jgi:hypothetical protein
MTPSSSSAQPPWPPLAAAQLSRATRALAAGVAEPALRAQLEALATAIDCLGAQPGGGESREGEASRSGSDAQPEGALARALAAGDETAVIDAARRLAAADRGLVPPVDWSAVSGG